METRRSGKDAVRRTRASGSLSPLRSIKMSPTKSPAEFRKLKRLKMQKLENKVKETNLIVDKKETKVEIPKDTVIGKKSDGENSKKSDAVILKRSDSEISKKSDSEISKKSDSETSKKSDGMTKSPGIRTRLTTGSIHMNGTTTVSTAKEKAEQEKILKQIEKESAQSALMRTKRRNSTDVMPADHPPPKRRKIGRNDGSGEDNRNDYYCWLCHKEGTVVCCELCPRVYHTRCLELAGDLHVEVSLPPLISSPEHEVLKDNRNDYYCWLCHKEGTVVCCELCPRVYHTRCLELAGDLPNDWACPECEQTIRAECIETQSKSMAMLKQDQLCALLLYALDRMKHGGSEPFQKPVDLVEVSNYSDYVFNPMDLETLEKNVKKHQYGSTEAFLADTKWIQHNCIIYNGAHHKITGSAKAIVKICKHEMNEIELCPDCYLNSQIRKNNEWFSELCRIPHTLVWAKLKGYPFWPAKALREEDGQVDVRFFGAHDRSWVPVSQCFLLSKNIPTSLQKGKKNAGLDGAIEELNTHVLKLRDKYGHFEYAPFRTPYDKADAYKPTICRPQQTSVTSQKPFIPVALPQKSRPNILKHSKLSSRNAAAVKKVKNKYTAIVPLKKIDLSPSKAFKYAADLLKEAQDHGGAKSDGVGVPVDGMKHNDQIDDTDHHEDAGKLVDNTKGTQDNGNQISPSLKDNVKDNRESVTKQILKKSFVSMGIVEKLEKKIQGIDQEQRDIGSDSSADKPVDSDRKNMETSSEKVDQHVLGKEPVDINAGKEGKESVGGHDNISASEHENGGKTTNSLDISSSVSDKVISCASTETTKDANINKDTNIEKEANIGKGNVPELKVTAPKADINDAIHKTGNSNKDVNISKDNVSELKGDSSKADDNVTIHTLGNPSVDKPMIKNTDPFTEKLKQTIANCKEKIGASGLSSESNEAEDEGSDESEDEYDDNGDDDGMNLSLVMSASESEDEELEDGDEEDIDNNDKAEVTDSCDDAGTVGLGEIGEPITKANATKTNTTEVADSCDARGTVDSGKAGGPTPKSDETKTDSNSDLVDKVGEVCSEIHKDRLAEIGKSNDAIKTNEAMNKSPGKSSQVTDTKGTKIKTVSDSIVSEKTISNKTISDKTVSDEMVSDKTVLKEFYDKDKGPTQQTVECKEKLVENEKILEIRSDKTDNHGFTAKVKDPFTEKLKLTIANCKEKIRTKEVGDKSDSCEDNLMETDNDDNYEDGGNDDDDHDGTNPSLLMAQSDEGKEVVEAMKEDNDINNDKAKVADPPNATGSAVEPKQTCDFFVETGVTNATNSVQEDKDVGVLNETRKQADEVTGHPDSAGDVMQKESCDATKETCETKKDTNIAQSDGVSEGLNVVTKDGITEEEEEGKINNVKEASDSVAEVPADSGSENKMLAKCDEVDSGSDIRSGKTDYNGYNTKTTNERASFSLENTSKDKNENKDQSKGNRASLDTIIHISESSNKTGDDLSKEKEILGAKEGSMTQQKSDRHEMGGVTTEKDISGTKDGTMTQQKSDKHETGGFRAGKEISFTKDVTMTQQFDRCETEMEISEDDSDIDRLVIDLGSDKDSPVRVNTKTTEIQKSSSFKQVTSPLVSSESQKNNAESHKDGAESHKDGAESHKQSAESHKQHAESHKDLAESHKQGTAIQGETSSLKKNYTVSSEESHKQVIDLCEDSSLKHNTVQKSSSKKSPKKKLGLANLGNHGHGNTKQKPPVNIHTNKSAERTNDVNIHTNKSAERTNDVNIHTNKSAERTNDSMMMLCPKTGLTKSAVEVNHEATFGDLTEDDIIDVDGYTPSQSALMPKSLQSSTIIAEMQAPTVSDTTEPDTRLIQMKNPNNNLPEKYMKKMVSSIQSVFTEMAEEMNTLQERQSPSSEESLSLQYLKMNLQNEMEELRHNFLLTVKEMQTSWASQREQITKEFKQRLANEIELEKRVMTADFEKKISDVKKQQWCANCQKEALFFCCWNTSYCDYPCQQAHWHQHASSCLQTNKAGNNEGKEKDTEKTTTQQPVQQQNVAGNMGAMSSSQMITGSSLPKNTTTFRSLPESLVTAIRREEEKRGEGRTNMGSKFVPVESLMSTTSPVVPNFHPSHMKIPPQSTAMVNPATSRMFMNQTIPSRPVSQQSLTNPMLLQQPIIQQPVYPVQLQTQQPYNSAIVFPPNPNQQNILRFNQGPRF